MPTCHSVLKPDQLGEPTTTTLSTRKGKLRSKPVNPFRNASYVSGTKYLELPRVRWFCCRSAPTAVTIQSASSLGATFACRRAKAVFGKVLNDDGEMTRYDGGTYHAVLYTRGSTTLIGLDQGNGVMYICAASYYLCVPSAVVAVVVSGKKNSLATLINQFQTTAVQQNNSKTSFRVSSR